MNEDVMNLIRREVDRRLNALAHPKCGVVSSYDPKAHAVKLKLQPEDNETGWVPVGSMHVGNGFGMAFGPAIGDQFMVGFHEGDHDSPFIMARMFSDQDKPPEVQSGELMLKHKDGTNMMIDKDSQFKIGHKSGGSLVWDKDGKINIDNAGRDINFKGVLKVSS